MNKEIDNINLFNPHSVEMSDEEISAFWDKVEESFNEPYDEEKTKQH